MRLLVLLLLLVNIAFFSWQLGLMPWLPWQPSQFMPVPQPVPTEQNAPKKLVLLSEQTTAVNPTNSPPVTTTPAVNPSIDTTKTEAKTGTESAVNTATTQTPVAAETTNTIPPVETMTNPVNIETPNTATHTTAIASEATVTTNTMNTTTLASNLSLETSMATPTTPSVATVEITPITSTASITNDSKVSLAANTSATIASVTTNVPTKLSEANSAQPKPESTQKTTQARPKVKEMCYQAGPYVQSATAQSAVAWFKRRNIYAKVQHRQAQMLEFTWVYLPPFKNRQAALQAQQRLLQRGIRDHLIIRTKYHTNGISLGLYRDQLSVERRLREVIAKGFNTVRTEKHYKNSTRYWLNVKIPKGQSEVGVTFGKVFKGSALESIACE